MTITIASTSCVDPRAELDYDVEVGPYCVIGPDVKIGRGTRLIAHVNISGEVAIGEFNTIGPFAAIGGAPQDVSYLGTPTSVVIGDHNSLREGVTIHRASEKEDGVTRIGSHNALMALAHVAHDCRLGDGITLAEGTMLGGHVHLEDHVQIARGVAVIHYITIGSYVSVGMKSKVTQDVPHYMEADGYPAQVRSVNAEALRRDGFSDAAIEALQKAHALIYVAKLGLPKATEILCSTGLDTPEVLQLIACIESQQRGKHGRSRGS